MTELLSCRSLDPTELEHYGAEGVSENESLPLDTAEMVALSIALDINQPLLESLRQEYGPKRQWKLCGPDSVLRARFMSAASGIPFRRDGKDKHLEIAMGFLPSGQEHAFIRLVRPREDRDNEIVVIDGTSNLQFGVDISPNRSLLIKAYNELDFWLDMRRDHNLYPYGSKDGPHLSDIDPWDDGAGTFDITDYEDHLAMLHDDQIFSHRDKVTTCSGKAYDISNYWGKHLVCAAERTFAKMPPGMINSLDAIWHAQR